jgi:hypothetical protein
VKTRRDSNKQNDSVARVACGIGTVRFRSVV